MDNAGDHTPDHHVIVIGNHDRAVGIVFGHQPGLAALAVQPLDGQLAFDRGNDDAALARLDTAVHHQDIIFVNPGLDHVITTDPHEKCSRRFVDQVFIEIKAAFEVIISR